MDKTTFEQKLKDLLEQIEGYSAADDQPVLGGIEFCSKLNWPVSNNPSPAVQDWLDILRLRVKYLVFDLEATRRENSYLKRLLEGPED